MSSSIKFIYFDIGNVFMTYDKVFRKVITDFNLNQEELDRVYEPYDIDANLGKINIPEVWSVLCQKLNIVNGSDYDFIKSWVSDYESLLPMHEFAKSLENKYKLGIISNYYNGFFEECLRQGYIPSINFNEVIISAAVGLMKPDPRIYELAQKNCGYTGNDILFIDDKLENIVAAQKLGWSVFQFDYRNPNVSVANMKEVFNLR